MARILMVNDEPDLLEVCRMILTSAGHEVSTTVHEVDAVALAATTDLDLVLIDWVMPEMGGAEVFQQLRRIVAPKVPIVVMSALPDGETRARSVGADGFVQKPLEADRLIRAVERSLRGRSRGD